MFRRGVADGMVRVDLGYYTFLGADGMVRVDLGYYTFLVLT